MSSPHEIRYSYNDVPTLRDFALSDAFFRGLVGPIGCTSGDTEFLTPAGWKRIDAYEPGDQVAQWDETGRISFVNPVEYVVVPAKELIEFDCGSLIMRLTPEHRVPHYDWAKRFLVKTAGEIEHKRSRRTIPTTFIGHRQDGLGMSDDMIRFAVMMHADGHYPKAGQKAHVCIRKERKKIRLRALLSRLGVEYTERVSKGRPTEARFAFVPPYRGKRYTGFWWSASQRELAIVLDEMRYWDGHINEMLTFVSTFKEDSDFIQYAAHANGLRASVAEVHYDEPGWKSIHRVLIRMGDNAKNRACIREGTNISRIPAPGGVAYCFVVPTSFFIARCENTIFVTGNSGKSSASAVEIGRRGQMQKPGPDGVRRTRFAIIRNTQPELRDTTIKTFFQWFPPQYFGRYIEHKHTYNIKAFTGCDIEVLFLALDRPDDVKKLLSLELTGAWVNEAREVPWAIIEMLQGRVGRYPAKRDGGATWYGLWGDTNPPDVDSKWYRYFQEKSWLKDFQALQRSGDMPADMKPEEFVASFQQPGGLSDEAENLSNLPGGRRYYANLASGKSKDWVTVYIDGQYGFVVDGKPVFPEYNDRLHCQDINPIAGVPIYRGWDFGLTPSCSFSQLLPDGRWLVFDELVADGMGIERFSEDVLEHCTRCFPMGAEFIDYGDPAGEQRAQTDERTCFEILWAKGIEIEGGEQAVAIRLESVRKPLRTLTPGSGEPQFILNPRCKVTRKALKGGYQFRRMQVSGERYSSAPDKNAYSHIMDALQYVATRLFGGGLTSSPRDDDDFDRAGDMDYAALATRSPTTGY